MEEEFIENMNLASGSLPTRAPASGPEETETERLHSQAHAREPEPQPECKIDLEKLEKLMALCREEYPHIPEYFIYTYSVDHLMENNNEI